MRICSIVLTQHFNDIHIHTYVYSVTPVTAQDYNPVYTRICIHTVFSCQVCFNGNRHFAFYQDNNSAWGLMVHGFSEPILMSHSGKVYHLVCTHRKNPLQLICCTRLPLTVCKALDNVFYHRIPTCALICCTNVRYVVQELHNKWNILHNIMIWQKFTQHIRKY